MRVTCSLELVWWSSQTLTAGSKVEQSEISLSFTEKKKLQYYERNKMEFEDSTLVSLLQEILSKVNEVNMNWN